MASLERSPTTTKKLRFFSWRPLRMRVGIRESLHRIQSQYAKTVCSFAACAWLAYTVLWVDMVATVGRPVIWNCGRSRWRGPKIAATELRAFDYFILPGGLASQIHS